ncbi:uncharacterized protein LOC120006871 [Tripterygium wilfordii]|uniref:uncharacterized protein LOC120006871 n=1 Tax=Tripterygium wilfordii TaxID=458696 RepID=UPI0018F84792|nr:uncharacterized protein LOC120006871 [Tripterygium wilfordii]
MHGNVPQSSASLLSMANVCCSIELEPRTLKEGQLNHAREVAADVVQNMQPSDASDIFIKGLRSDVPVEPEEMDSKNGMETGNEHMLEDCKKKPPIVGKPCHCATNDVTESPHDLQNKLITEPLSAPF